MGTPFWQAINAVAVDVMVAFAGVFVGGTVTYFVVGRVERMRQERAARQRLTLANARREGAAEAMRPTKADDKTPKERGGRS
jgi:hypothetical protein